MILPPPTSAKITLMPRMILAYWLATATLVPLVSDNIDNGVSDGDKQESLQWQDLEKAAFDNLRILASKREVISGVFHT